MAEETERDWVLPAILIGLVLIGVAAFVVGYLVGRETTPEPTTVGERLEAWTACLNEAGANVPQVEARGDGGFTIIVDGSMVDGSMLEEQPEPQDFLQAVAACAHVAPDLGFLGSALQPFAGEFIPGTRFPFGGDDFRSLPEFRQRFDREPLAEICDRLAHADELPLDNEQIRELLRMCRLIDE